MDKTKTGYGQEGDKSHAHTANDEVPQNQKLHPGKIAGENNGAQPVKLGDKQAG